MRINSAAGTGELSWSHRAFNALIRRSLLLSLPSPKSLHRHGAKPAEKAKVTRASGMALGFGWAPVRPRWVEVEALVCDRYRCKAGRVVRPDDILYRYFWIPFLNQPNAHKIFTFFQLGKS